MRVVLAGATGFIGARLVKTLSGRGDQLVVLTRSPQGRSATRLSSMPNVRVVPWDAESPGLWRSELDGADAVINLAGEPVVGKRWSEAQKRRILDSRVLSTRALVEAMAAARRPPAVLVNASAIGYYGAHGDETLDEAGPAGGDFLAQVCRDWEAEAVRAEPRTRVVVVRIGIVLGEEGGSLAEMVKPFRLGAGGPIGTGRQWVSWIHRDDLVAMLLFAVDHVDVRGVLNGTAPTPVRNAELAREMGRVLNRPSWLPAPKFALRVALGEVAAMLVEGQRVVPKRALEAGFSFAHPDLSQSLAELLR
jgi:uncharacterized protein (TIGR01777 family)